MSPDAAHAQGATDRLRICLLCVEIFAWGKYGGFGRAARTIGRELVRSGHEVTAIVPRRNGQSEQESLDGMRVLGYPQHRPWTIHRLAKMADADVYHSCEPSFASYVSRLAMRGRRHVVTVRDPRTLNDWRIELNLPSINKMQVAKNFLFEHNALVTSAVRNADAVFTAYRDAIPKVQQMYGLSRPPQFLPTPVRIPECPRKEDRPVVCYIGRLDRRKRPHLMIPVARRFPNVEFLVAGLSRDKKWEARLLDDLSSLPNIRILGFVDQFRSPLHSEILEKSWIFLNTAGREGLPNAFIEAAAHGCAILSSNNSDGFASKFGEHIVDSDFAGGLERLLAQNRWEMLGKAARTYVSTTFASEKAITSHLNAYRTVLAGERAALAAR